MRGGHYGFIRPELKQIYELDVSMSTLPQRPAAFLLPQVQNTFRSKHTGYYGNMTQPVSFEKEKEKTYLQCNIAFSESRMLGQYDILTNYYILQLYKKSAPTSHPLGHKPNSEPLKFLFALLLALSLVRLSLKQKRINYRSARNESTKQKFQVVINLFKHL